VQANVPGIQKDDIIVEINEGTLRLKLASSDTNGGRGGDAGAADVVSGGDDEDAERASDDVATGVPVEDVEQGGDRGGDGDGGVKWHRRERDAMVVDREIELPECADTSNVAAACEGGVLTIVFGKKAATSSVKRVKVA
jgi:HSP20 family molecular chaperone IbpA